MLLVDQKTYCVDILMTPTAQLYSLCELNGAWTPARLKRLGINEAAINQGHLHRVLQFGPAGSLLMAPYHRRHALRTKLAEDLKPGDEVVKMKDGHPVKVQTVKDDGGKVAFVNPDKIDDGIEVADTDQLTTKEGSEEIEKIFND